MRNLVAAATLLLALLPATLQAQHQFSTYHRQRESLFRLLPAGRNDIIFMGNSITNGCEWSELFGNRHIKNRGISGDVAEGILNRIDDVTAGRPAQIFLMIGTNDLAEGVPVDSVVSRTGRVLAKIRKASPKTLVYLQSVLPVTPHYGKFPGHTSRADSIVELNRRLKALADETATMYIDLHTPLTDPGTGLLDIRYTNDGLHLTGAGDMVWKEQAAPFVGESRAAYARRLKRQTK